MARIPKARDNYREEAIVMNRFAKIVELDTVSSIEWKTKVTVHLNAAMRLFLEHDSPGGNQNEKSV